MSRVDVALLLGRPPSPTSVLRETARLLLARGLNVASFVLDEPPTALPRAERYVLRSLPPGVLRELDGRLEAIRCVNTPTATGAVRDKARTARLLAAAGVPVPRTDSVDRWEQVLDRWGEGPVVVKSGFGSRGDGVLIPDGRPPPSRPPFHGPYVLQERIAAAGGDHKVYVIGERVAGVRRRFPARTLKEKWGIPFEPDRELAELARAVGRVLGLSVYGVDVLFGAAGPVVVDCNAVPGFKGVEGAATSLAEVLVSSRREAAPCAS